MGITTGFIRPDGADIGLGLVEKAYLIDRYPELANSLKQAGLWVWGRGLSGEMGNNAITSRSSPVQTVSGGTNWKLVACGTSHVAAIKTDGTLWTWGNNIYSQLGDNTLTNKSSPVQTVSGGTDWVQVSTKGTLNAAIKTDGSLWLWGRNIFGQLGDNSATNRSSPVQTVSGGTNWKQVSVSALTAAAIKTDGTLWIWGYNGYGAMGDGTTTTRSSPVQTISVGTNWQQVSCGNLHTAAIKTNGSLWTWGGNSYGQLGDGTSVSKSSPVQTVSGGTNWKSFSCGSAHSTAIKTDGTLWTWGNNNQGQLGDNTITNKSSPVQTVSGGTNWKQINSGNLGAAAIKTDGTMWTWGTNDYGALGDNTSVNKSSPVQTVSGGTNWKQIAFDGICVAIRDDSSDPI